MHNKVFEQKGGASLLTPRFHFKNENDEFDHPKYVEAFKKAMTSVWNYLEVPWEEDLKNWHEESEEITNIIGGVFRGFTQAECVIGDYWADYICKRFQKPEIVAMARWFSAFEALHAFAYNHTSSNLHLEEYKAFMGDETAKDKIDYLLNEVESDLVKLATFSGVEGIALFASFAILYSFNLRGKFKGLGQIISWSAFDEGGHSDWGARLFKDLKQEISITQEEVNQIIEAYKTIVNNEITFIRNAFEKVEVLNGISRECFEEYMKYKANERFTNLKIPVNLLPDSIDNLFPYDKELSEQVSEWFDPLTSGNVSNDFFAYGKEGSQYISKPTFKITGNLLEELNKR